MNTVWICLKPIPLELDFCLKYLILVFRRVLASARSFGLAGVGKVVETQMEGELEICQHCKTKQI